MRIDRNGSFRAAAALTAALAVAGCGGASERASEDQHGASMASGEHDANQSPVTLTGCLQRGDGDEYILTENIDTTTVGTSGERNQVGAADRVEPQQRSAAARSYRLNDGNDDQLDELVGQQVRVSGQISDQHDRNRSAVGTSGNETAGMRTGNEDSDAGRRAEERGRNSERQEIASGDLARVEVQSIERTGEPCGTAGTAVR